MSGEKFVTPVSHVVMMVSSIAACYTHRVVRILYFNNGYVISSNNLHYITITICNMITKRKTSTTKQRDTKFSPLGNPLNGRKPSNFFSIDLSMSKMSSSTIQELKAVPHKDLENKIR